ncbi:MAG: DUF4276 family protein [Bacteroidales bacterium]|nr:DUF4276 family protein [Bacteroidales bacterium]MDD4107197.1 DUF4276 family protein [Prolixibacteraceae bacterium]
MKRIYIVVEGQTEQEFVNSLLTPYLGNFGIHSITPILIRTSKSGRGGFVNYQHLENTINGLLKTSTSTGFIVTSFVDFFRIPHNMPKYAASMAEPTKTKQVKSLEKALNNAINDGRFIPYIQLHEFEALLFSNNNGFEYYFKKEHSIATRSIVDSFVNPEEINSSPQGAPSKRILNINKDYDKVTEGNLIALVVGISSILNKCPRFKAWLENLIVCCS